MEKYLSRLHYFLSPLNLALLRRARVNIVWKRTWPFKNQEEGMSPFSMLPYKDTLRNQLIHFTLLTDHWTLAPCVYVCAHTSPASHACTHMHIHAVSHASSPSYALHYWARGFGVVRCKPRCIGVDIYWCKGYSVLNLEWAVFGID